MRNEIDQLNSFNHINKLDDSYIDHNKEAKIPMPEMMINEFNQDLIDSIEEHDLCILNDCLLHLLNSLDEHQINDDFDKIIQTFIRIF